MAYPLSPVTWTDKIDYLDTVKAADVNQLYAETIAVEGDLINVVKPQLADNASQQEKLTASEKIEKKTYVTLMDDDGRAEFMTLVKPILDEYGYKMSVCINPGMIGTAGYMTWANIATLVSEGHEILNHGYVHAAPSTITLEQLQAYYEQEKTAFIAHGLNNYDYYVYGGIMPWTDIDSNNKVRKVYKCCFGNTDAPFNYIPFDNFNVRRTALTLTNAIGEINNSIAANGYCVLFGHAWMYDAPSLTLLRATLTHLQTNIAKITFVSAKTMLDNFENVINLGNVGYDKFLLDKNGNVDFSIGGKSINDLATAVFYPISGNFFTSKPLTSYKQNSITLEIVGSDYATYWLPNPGTVKTYRFTDDRYAYQEYTRIGLVEVWKRCWDNPRQVWIPFSPLIGVAVTTSTRPKYIKWGVGIFDAWLGTAGVGKLIFPTTDGYGVPFVQVARSTVYALGVYVNTTTDSTVTNSRLHICIVAGTTASTRPTYGTTLDYITTDGTAQFKEIGTIVTYIDAIGTTV